MSYRADVQRSKNSLTEKYGAEYVQRSLDWEQVVYAVQRGERPFTDEEREKARTKAVDLGKQYVDVDHLAKEGYVDGLSDQDLADGIVEAWWAAYREHF